MVSPDAGFNPRFAYCSGSSVELAVGNSVPEVVAQLIPPFCRPSHTLDPEIRLIEVIWDRYRTSRDPFGDLFRVFSLESRLTGFRRLTFFRCYSCKRRFERLEIRRNSKPFHVTEKFRVLVSLIHEVYQGVEAILPRMSYTRFRYRVLLPKGRRCATMTRDFKRNSTAILFAALHAVWHRYLHVRRLAPLSRVAEGSESAVQLVHHHTPAKPKCRSGISLGGQFSTGRAIATKYPVRRKSIVRWANEVNGIAEVEIIEQPEI
jgi:hypothetical protein